MIMRHKQNIMMNVLKVSLRQHALQETLAMPGRTLGSEYFPVCYNNASRAESNSVFQGSDDYGPIPAGDLFK